MSITPIFDATLADAPVNIWQASAIFPRPSRGTATMPDVAVQQPESFRDALIRIGHPNVPPLQPAFTDWTAVTKGASK